MRFTWAWAPATEDAPPSADDRSAVRRTYRRADRGADPRIRDTEGTPDHV